MTKPFTITASVGPKISSDEVSRLKREDDDLHKGVIIKTPYGKQGSFQILNNKNNTME